MIHNNHATRWEGQEEFDKGGGSIIGSPWVQTPRHGDPIDTAPFSLPSAPFLAICAPFCAQASPPTIRARYLWPREGAE
eukprot:COSAG01_NODE_1043_length_11954_cov_9.077014_6_plen_79_part_00